MDIFRASSDAALPSRSAVSLSTPRVQACSEKPQSSPVREEVKIRSQVRGLLLRLFPSGRMSVERRVDRRYPFPFLVQLSPVNPKSLEAIDLPLVVVGKSLSEAGLGFYHQKPLPYRQAIISLDGATGENVEFLIGMSWCRFTRYGWYESGGRFLRLISPIEP